MTDAPRFAAYGYDEHASTWESPEPHPDITATDAIWSAKDRTKRWDRGAFYVEREGERVAEQTFSAAPDGKLVIIDHTEIAESLRGQGIARKLTLAAVDWARKSGVKLVPVCPFAKAVFDRDPTIRDVLA